MLSQTAVFQYSMLSCYYCLVLRSMLQFSLYCPCFGWWHSSFWLLGLPSRGTVAVRLNVNNCYQNESVDTQGNLKDQLLWFTALRNEAKRKLNKAGSS